MTALAAGYTPNNLHFYEEEMVDVDAMNDVVARIVVSRFRDAKEAKKNNSVYQGKSTVRLLREADEAMEKRYTCEQDEAMEAAFGFRPSRYYGLSATKTTEIANWRSELVSADPGALVKIVPTPDPRLSESSIAAVKLAVKRELVERMVANGIGDPNLLISVQNGRLHPAVKTFLDGKAGALREIETARITSLALGTAAKIQVKMRDVVIEGGFREAYNRFSHDQIRYGIGILRFPHWENRIVMSDRQSGKGRPKRVWKRVPTFKTVSPWNFFPSNDGDTIQDCTYVCEYKEINKLDLVRLAQDSRYDSEAIIDILENYSHKARTWLFPDASEVESVNGERGTMWAPEELVAVIHHEGEMTGQDLLEHGLKGYKATEIYEVRAEVCCGRAIRVEIVNPLSELSRSYAVAHYEDLGPGVWNAVGVPGILHNSQERLNTMFALFESNLDESTRPPLLINSEALKNPGDARNIRPGGKYEISDLMSPGTTPDPVRPVRSVSAIFQIIWPLCQQVIRQADHEVSIPSLSDLSSFGKGSLGELSARVSAAVRRIRASAYSEDRSLGDVWQVLFEHVLDENPELVENADLDLHYLGIVGLLTAEAERKAKIERLGLIAQGMQAGVVPSTVAEFGYHDALKDFGIPVESLGMDSPLVKNSIALAIQGGGIPGAGAGANAGAPQLDGRSGAISQIPTAISTPNGGGSGVVPPA